MTTLTLQPQVTAQPYLGSSLSLHPPSGVPFSFLVALRSSHVPPSCRGSIPEFPFAALASPACFLLPSRDCSTLLKPPSLAAAAGGRESGRGPRGSRQGGVPPGAHAGAAPSPSQEPQQLIGQRHRRSASVAAVGRRAPTPSRRRTRRRRRGRGRGRGRGKERGTGAVHRSLRRSVSWGRTPWEQPPVDPKFLPKVIKSGGQLWEDAAGPHLEHSAEGGPQ